MTNNFFSWKTKIAIFKELRNKSQVIDNETISQFFERHFNKEIVDYAVTPFVTGIYAGNPAELLVAKTFPQLVEYEKQYGSILKGFIKNNKVSRKESINFRDGLGTLPRKLAEKLGIFYNQKVENITYKKKFSIQTQTQTFDCEKLIITSPSFCATEFWRFAPCGRRQIFGRCFVDKQRI